MTSVKAAATRVRRRVNGSHRPVLDQLAAGVDASTTDVTLKFGDRGPAAGGYLEIDGELMYCVTQVEDELTVIRAQGGSSASSHLVDHEVLVDPDPAEADIVDALQTAIEALPTASVARVVDEDLTFATDKTFAPIAATDVIGILGRGIVAPSGTYQRADEFDLDFVRDPDNDLGGAAGYGARIPRNQFVTESLTVNVTLACTFDTSAFDRNTQLESTVGLSKTLVDSVVYSAAAEMLEQREAVRSKTDSQVASRTAAEVQPTQSLTLAQTYRQQASILLTEESKRFRRQYGGWTETR